jgi:selenocysteine lyase/cysteine desulfurase
MNPLESQRSAFQIPDSVHWLNCAYMSPTPRNVEEAGVKALIASRDPSTLSASGFFEPAERIRAAFARLLGVPETAHQVSLIPAASYAIATAARNIPVGQGDEIVHLQDQFPSNVYAWRRLASERGATVRSVPRVPTAAGWNVRLLEAITPRTRIVAVPHVHWTDGTLFDLEAVGQRARDMGAYLIIDGTQSVGALPIDLPAIQPDLVAAAGYKWLMGPYATGLAWWGERMLDGIPLEENWISRKGSSNFAGLVDYVDDYAPGAIKYDVGERSNFLLLPMVEAALALLLEWQPERIQDWCQRLTSPALAELAGHGFMAAPETDRAHHLFGLSLPGGMEPAAVQERLRAAGVHVSVRGKAVRISPHVYNTERDLQALVDVLLSP